MAHADYFFHLGHKINISHHSGMTEIQTQSSSSSSSSSVLILNAGLNDLYFSS